MDLTQFANLATNVGFYGALLVAVWLTGERNRAAEAARYDKLVDKFTVLIANNTEAMHRVSAVAQQNCEQIEAHDARTSGAVASIGRIDAGIVRIEAKQDRVYEVVTNTNHRSAG